LARRNEKAAICLSNRANLSDPERGPKSEGDQDAGREVARLQNENRQNKVPRRDCKQPARFPDSEPQRHKVAESSATLSEADLPGHAFQQANSVAQTAAPWPCS